MKYNDVSNYVSYRFLENNQLLGETDIVCFTKDRGILIFEVKSSSESSMHMRDNVEKAWKQVQKASIVIKVLNSEMPFLNNIVVHKLIAFPDISFGTLQNILCDRHLKLCICRENLSNQENFETFLENYFSLKGFEYGNSYNSIS